MTNVLRSAVSITRSGAGVIGRFAELCRWRYRLDVADTFKFRPLAIFTVSMLELPFKTTKTSHLFPEFSSGKLPTMLFVSIPMLDNAPRWIIEVSKNQQYG